MKVLYALAFLLSTVTKIKLPKYNENENDIYLFNQTNSTFTVKITYKL